MAVLTRRTRVVSFRVSEEEYQALIDICLTRQARSLSDFARFVTLQQFEVDSSEMTKAEGTLQQIQRKLGVIDREVRRIAGLIEPQPIDTSRPLEAVTSRVEDSEPRAQQSTA
jgi:DNA helicase TIP49 (TBP-interacting protein)